MTSPSPKALSPDFVAPVDGGLLQVLAIGDRAFRVRFTPDRAASGVPESTILSDCQAATRLATRNDGRRSTLELPHIRCEFDSATGQLRFFGSEGRVLLEETPNGRQVTPAMLGEETVHRVAQSFESPPDERLYGTGCFQDGALNIRGLSRRLTQVNSQISLPFILSSHGYGLLWHQRGMSEFNPLPHRAELRQRAVGQAQVDNVTTTSGNAQLERRLATFAGEINVTRAGRHALMLEIGRVMGSRYRVDIDGKTLVDFTNLWLPPTMSFMADLEAGTHEVVVEANDTDAPSLLYGPVHNTTVWRTPVADAIDYVVIAGPSADAIMGAYRDMLGASPMLPIWSYGYVHCRERFRSSEDIIDTLDEFRRRRLPVDVMVQDWQYWGKHGWNAMRFDEDHYPDPAALVREVHARNARLMLSVWSRIGRDTELGKEVARRGYYIEDTEWVDFFNPEARDFYCAMQEERLGKFGIDSWWQDATEPENDDLAGRMTAGGPGEHVRLVYPLEVTRAVYESRRATDPDQRVSILTRCAFLGQHRYGAITWSGDVGNDWETLKRQIPAGLNMAAAGYPYWTVDAGGFFRPGDGQYTDPAYHERFLRWFQYATFLPMLRVHGYQTNTEFWRYGPEVESISRRYLELRYRMLPYIYSLAADTAATGAPIMRPLVFDFTDDAEALDQAHSYMFGRVLHVAPVVEASARSWPVYLPRTDGGWFDFWTGEHRSGGTIHEVPVSIETIPLHVRAGGIVPLGPVLQSTAEATGERLELCVAPGADGVFDLYEDQGLDSSYETGAFSAVPMRWDDANNALTIGARRGTFKGMLTRRRFVVRRIGPGTSPDSATEGVEVTYAGEAITVDLPE